MGLHVAGVDMLEGPDGPQVLEVNSSPGFEGLERATAAVFFSATLTPLDYYRSLIGGSPEDSLLQLGSPFRPENLATLVHDRIRTHFKDRADSLSQVVEAIVTHLEGRRGNYLVYFPSYQYLACVLEQFQAVKTSFRVLAQRPAMSETEREQFLAAFASEHAETLVGFAVMCGVFGLVVIKNTHLS